MSTDPRVLDIARQFTRESFTFQGNHLAIVENNEDTEMRAGRVQVRIFGLHSPLSSETPVEHLPWASPCLSIGWSGGHNLVNSDKPANNTRYNPGNQSDTSIPPKNVTSLDPKNGKFVDNIENDCGTGGYFQVPRKGTIVWVFFENGDHNKCHYWSASTKKLDWDEQGKKITSDVNEKIDQIRKLRSEFKPDRDTHKGNSPANGAEVQTFCSKPRMSIYPIDGIPNHNITSHTTPNGTTFIIVNDNGKERVYVINKGYISHINEYGHKKELIGPTEVGNDKINSNDEKLVAGHSELHVMGDYDVFVNGNCFFQINGNAQINANKNVGILSKTGDVDILVEKGHCNVDVIKGNMNAHVGGDLQMKVDGNVNAKIDRNVDLEVKGNVSAQVTGDTNIESTGSIGVKSNANMTLEAVGDLSMTCNSLKISANSSANISSPSGFNVNAGSTFGVNAQGFGGNIAMFVPISNAFHVGCFAGGGAGPATPLISVAEPAIPYIPVVLSPFSQSRKSERVSSGTTSNEQKDNVDVPGNPDITSTPS